METPTDQSFSPLPSVSTSSPTDSGSAAGESSSPSVPPETDPTAHLRIGSSATIIDGQDTFTLTVDSLTTAPESIYDSGTFERAAGPVYFLTFTVRADAVNPTYFGTDSINGLFLSPFRDGKTAGKRHYGSVEGCRSVVQQLQPGESAQSCYSYQAAGAPITEVTYDDVATHHIVWK